MGTFVQFSGDYNDLTGKPTILNAADVDARISPWTRITNTDLIPDAKVNVPAWARANDSSAIPEAKLVNAPDEIVPPGATTGLLRAATATDVGRLATEHSNLRIEAKIVTHPGTTLKDFIARNGEFSVMIGLAVNGRANSVWFIDRRGTCCMPEPWEVRRGWNKGVSGRPWRSRKEIPEDRSP